MTTLTLPCFQLKPTWRLPLLALTALLLLLLWRFADTVGSVVAIWSASETYTHAYLVVPLTLWLVWRRRKALQQLVPQPGWSALLLMVCAVVLWWLGRVAHVNAAMHLGLVALLVASVPAVLGWQVARVVAFPLAFMFFAAPVGEILTPLLMQWTADFVVGALRFTGIPVYREGQQLVIPSGRWAVVEACSGIRYLMASVMVGSLFAYINYQSLKRRLIFFALSIVVPIVANWLRAYIIVMLGHLSNNRIATGVDHLVYGWVFFGIVILTLFFVAARWAEPDPAPGAALAQRVRDGARPSRHDGRVLVSAALALGVALLPGLLPGKAGDAAQSSGVTLTLPQSMGTWRATSNPLAKWSPIHDGAARQQTVAYESAQGVVGVYVAYYRNQSDSAKLISSTNVLLRSEDENWQVVAQGQRDAPSAGGLTHWRTATLLASERTAAAQRGRLTVWHLYWVAGHLTNSDVLGKLWQAWAAIRGDGDDAAAVYVYCAQADDGAADHLLGAFIEANFGLLQATLEQTRMAR